jgi:hypothetical protein
MAVSSQLQAPVTFSQARALQHLLLRRLDGSQSWSVCCKKEKNSYTVLEQTWGSLIKI